MRHLILILTLLFFTSFQGNTLYLVTLCKLFEYTHFHHMSTCYYFFFQIEEIFTDLNHCRMPWMQESRSSDICQDKSKLINLAQIVKCAPHNIAAPHHSRCTNSTWENSLKSCSRLQPCKHRLKSLTFTNFSKKKG